MVDYRIPSLKCKVFVTFARNNMAMLSAICWGSSIRAKDSKKLNKLIRKAGSVLGFALEPLELIIEQRIMHKLLNLCKSLKNEALKVEADLNIPSYCIKTPIQSKALRPPNRSNAQAILRQQGEYGESASQAEPLDCPQPSEAEPSIRAVPYSLLVYQSRSPLFRTLSRSSSGYFSFDSEPSSPLITTSTGTQTPSPSSQVITHALQRISEAQGAAQNYELWPTLHNHYPPQGAASEGDMHAELYVAQELRRIGDEFNRLYFQRAGRIGGAHQPAHNEPAVMLWLRLLIRRLLQLILRQ
ncbi:bcl-2-like protein 11 [Trichomycterus rosablanca]|uniref:bcl-2-like protein 11 n=1 Tax=Trichomycterus rosablanca TaxID=2290929 RepID=UPI002F35DB9D